MLKFNAGDASDTNQDYKYRSEGIYLVVLHAITFTVSALIYNAKAGDKVSNVLMAFIVPIYILVLSYGLPYTVYLSRSINFNRATVDDYLLLDHLFGLFLMELIVLFGLIFAGIIYMFMRSIFPESFLQEEWMHAQPQIFNNLD